jgi:tetratricopeptide (TPR) repeat protein
MLVERYQGDQLLNLDTIDLAFIRPRDAGQWQQAYLQAQLYVEFVAKRYGQDSIGKMLAEFGKGKNAVEAIAAVCKVDKAEFEKAYREYVGGVVKTIKGPKAAQKRRSLAELQKANKADPEDVEVNAELAVRLLPTARRADARKHAEAALAKKADHPRALYVVAMLEKRAQNDKKAMELLEKALNKDDPEPLVAKALGKIYYDAMEYDKAANALELGRKADPFDKDWLVELARVYARKDDRDKQIEILKELVPLDADDLDRRIRLAGMLNAAGKPAEGEKYAREALNIDVMKKEAREHLYKSLRDQKKEEELNKVKKLLEP